MGMTYATLGNYDSSFYYCTKSLNIRQKMSDHACVVLSYINMGQLYNAAGSFTEALDYYNQGIHYAYYPPSGSSLPSAGLILNW